MLPTRDYKMLIPTLVMYTMITFSIFVPSTFNLIGRRCGSPFEIFRKFSRAHYILIFVGCSRILKLNQFFIEITVKSSTYSIATNTLNNKITAFMFVCVKVLWVFVNDFLVLYRHFWNLIITYYANILQILFKFTLEFVYMCQLI